MLVGGHASWLLLMPTLGATLTNDTLVPAEPQGVWGSCLYSRPAVRHSSLTHCCVLFELAFLGKKGWTGGKSLLSISTHLHYFKDHIVEWLGRRVVAATTQVRLLVWSFQSIAAPLPEPLKARRLPWGPSGMLLLSWLTPSAAFL